MKCLARESSRIRLLSVIGYTVHVQYIAAQYMKVRLCM